MYVKLDLMDGQWHLRFPTEYQEGGKAFVPDAIYQAWQRHNEEYQVFDALFTALDNDSENSYRLQRKEKTLFETAAKMPSSVLVSATPPPQPLAVRFALWLMDKDQADTDPMGYYLKEAEDFLALPEDERWISALYDDFDHMMWIEKKNKQKEEENDTP